MPDSPLEVGGSKFRAIEIARTEVARTIELQQPLKLLDTAIDFVDRLPVDLSQKTDLNSRERLIVVKAGVIVRRAGRLLDGEELTPDELLTRRLMLTSPAMCFKPDHRLMPVEGETLGRLRQTRNVRKVLQAGIGLHAISIALTAFPKTESVASKRQLERLRSSTLRAVPNIPHTATRQKRAHIV